MPHRFHVDDIVHPEARALAEQFTCGICFSLIEEPVQTICNHVFCGPCLAPCAGGPCPSCRSMLPPGEAGKSLRDCNQVVLRRSGEGAVC